MARQRTLGFTMATKHKPPKVKKKTTLVMNKRVHHSQLSAAEKKSFIDAILALKNVVNSVLHRGKQKRYDDFVEVHKNAMTGAGMFHPMPHGTSLFYPWRRALPR